MKRSLVLACLIGAVSLVGLLIVGCAQPPADALQAGETDIEVTVLGRKIRFDAEEVAGIRGDINSQIYARDFALIDQADMIISYIPQLADGRAAISSGVERELQHAHEAAKDVYVIWTPQADPSVFITQTATKVFAGTPEAMDFFGKEFAAQSGLKTSGSGA